MSDIRDLMIAFRASPKEKRALKILAAREDMHPSEFMRLLIRREAERKEIHAIGLIGLLDGKKLSGPVKTNERNPKAYN